MKVNVDPPRIVVPGFRFAGVACGLKQSGKRDVALIVSNAPATVAAVFTTNRVKAAPVILGRERVRSGRTQAVLINSGNANAYTGKAGLSLAREMTALVATRLKIDPSLVIPSSTGRIGVQVPRAKIRRGVVAACAGLDVANFGDALEGIMTTDAFAKYASTTVKIDRRSVTIAGMCKGAGMIAPNMATMLAYLLTDARVSRPVLQRALREVLPESFNAIVVDGDMSTNDTVLLLANGVAGNRSILAGSREYAAFTAALADITRKMARMVVKDGEGATKVIEIRVRGARTVRDAERVADTIARSPLCKTAFYGGDPYAGRIVCAAGYSGAKFDPDLLDVYLGEIPIVKNGEEVVGKVEKKAARIVAKDEFVLTLDLHAGAGAAMRLASDLTPDYVKFNSDYRT